MSEKRVIQGGQRSANKNERKLPRIQPPGHVWEARTTEFEFLKGSEAKGGFFGVTLILTLENADRLSKNLKGCIRTAQKYKKDKVEVRAHWANRNKEAGGYLLRTKAK